jgi:very-short-patch-repair endonuclease
MKNRLDVNSVDWESIQKMHDSGTHLNALGLSRNMINLGVKLGFFTKQKISQKLSDERKENISKHRKKWLKENPDKHPWRNSNKFISIPCEQLKEYLRSINIEFVEEALISDSKNYSVDILIPSKNLILEINGNQHYNRDGSLKEYYKNRHDHITSLGWKVLEIHCSMAFNHKLIKDLIELEHYASKIIPFRFREPKKRKYGTSKDYANAMQKKWLDDNLHYIKLIQESEIDFSKQGWVTKISYLLNIPVQKVNVWMKRLMPDFYETSCFKRNQKSS